MNRTSAIRIGNAGGYWGDDPNALKRQIEHGHLDYITMDFLAEVTMSILQKQFVKNPELGYAKDFIPMLKGVLKDLLTNKTKLITNAGGINPRSCAKAIKELGKELGLNPKVAIVYGDDILCDLDKLEEDGIEFTNMETGESFTKVKNKIVAANVYFGAAPVVEALKKWDPDIIITGRVTDTGITLAPMIYEFGWELNDWNKLASGVIAGHMLECGSQITGGNFSDWEKVEDFNNIGFPIAEVNPDSSFILTKHDHTGGYVSVDTVREQLFYEMGDPKSYLTPDVVADFTSIKLEQWTNSAVKVTNIRGWEPTKFYKVSMGFDDGYKAVGSILLSGPNAKAKADCFAKIFWNRMNAKFEDTLTEYLGWDACHRSLGGAIDANEIILRLGARSYDNTTLHSFAKLIPSLILSGPPGVAVLGGVPKIQSVVSYWPALLPKEKVHAKIALCNGGDVTESFDVTYTQVGNFTASDIDIQSAQSVDMTIEEVLANNSLENLVSLYELCLARSGDKGDSVNIGVLARSSECYQFLKEILTAQLIKNLFQELCHGEVVRYELDNLNGLNFILKQSLGGGGSCTLRADAQGKTFSQALLRQKVVAPKSVVQSCQS